jgi:hypothetical protein
MVNQTIDINSLELQLQERVARYQQKYKVSNADLAWVFLRIGTSYYFKDICTRGLRGTGQRDAGGRI